MSAPSPAAEHHRQAGRARVGISLFFLLNGFVTAGLLARLPEVKDALSLDALSFGFVLAAFPLGSIAAAWLPAPLIRRYGAVQVTAAGTLAMACGVAAAGTAPLGWILAAILFLVGFADAVVDASQNVHGLEVEQMRGSSIFNSLHAAWSLGGVTGGGLGLAAAAAHIPLPLHLLLTGLLAVGATVCAWMLSRPARRAVHDRSVGAEEPADISHAPGGGAGSQQAPRARRPWGLLGAIIALGLLGALIEDLGMNWSAVYLNQVAGAAVESAGLGFVVALGGQLIARLLADPVTDRWGRTAVVRAGGLLVVAGMVLAMAVAEPWTVLLAFLLSGFGSATFIPSSYAAAGRLPGFGHGTAITLTSWVLRMGMLSSSPLLGATASLIGLRWALLITLLAGAGAVAVAGWISHSRTCPGSNALPL